MAACAWTSGGKDVVNMGAQGSGDVGDTIHRCLGHGHVVDFVGSCHIALLPNPVLPAQKIRTKLRMLAHRGRTRQVGAKIRCNLKKKQYGNSTARARNH